MSKTQMRGPSAIPHQEPEAELAIMKCMEEGPEVMSAHAKVWGREQERQADSKPKLFEASGKPMPGALARAQA